VVKHVESEYNIFIAGFCFKSTPIFPSYCSDGRKNLSKELRHEVFLINPTDFYFLFHFFQFLKKAMEKLIIILVKTFSKGEVFS